MILPRRAHLQEVVFFPTLFKHKFVLHAFINVNFRRYISSDWKGTEKRTKISNVLFTINQFYIVKIIINKLFV